MELQVIKLEVVEETIAVVRFANPPHITFGYPYS